MKTNAKLYRPKTSPYYYADYTTFEGKRRRVSLATDNEQWAKSMLAGLLAAEALASRRSLCSGTAYRLIHEIEESRRSYIDFNRFWPRVRQLFYESSGYLIPHDPRIVQICQGSITKASSVLQEAYMQGLVSAGREHHYGAYRLRELPPVTNTSKKLMRVVAAASEIGRVKQAA